jgi:hypothetical protein
MNSEYVVSQEQIGKYTVKVLLDENPESPREWDNFGVMICWHNRYNLGDDNGKGNCQRQFPEPEDFTEFEKENKLIKLPLRLYEHSGISMSTSNSYPYNDIWDSGQVGWIFITYENIKKKFNCKRITKTIKEKVINNLIGEVKTYDAYLTGQVYGFRVEDEEGNNVDSCWGFYGKEDCLQEGISMAQWNIQNDIKEHCKKVRT